MLKSLEIKKNWVTLVLSIGVIQLSAYYFLGSTVRHDGLFAAAQPDTALYMQAARRIVEGAPFSYSVNEPLCTGTTSVLCPFLLAPLYLIGGAGSALAFGFFLNAVFYLIFLFCWSSVIDLKSESRISCVAAAVGLALFGQSVFSAAAQSDIGLWMAVSAAIAYAMACERVGLTVFLLCLAPWVRPEGVILVLAYAAVARRPRALLPLLSVASLFALNWLLTGSCQFSSVQGKGYFAQQPFPLAIISSALDAIKMFRQLFLGGSSGSFREFFFLPVIGAFFLWYRVFTRDYARFSCGEGVFLLAVAGGFATVATSGMQGTNFDRYLAWGFPVMVIWMAEGAVSLGSRLNGFASFLPVVLLELFFAAGAVASVAHFRLGCEQTETVRAFYERCESAMEDSASVASYGNSGAVYSFSPRRFAHLYGIYSPEFRSADLVQVFEQLKHEPGLRTVYSIYDPSVEGEVVGKDNAGVFGETVLAGPLGLELRRFDWRMYDDALSVNHPSGSRLCDSLDVGYASDEVRCGYEVSGDYLQPPPEPFLRLDRLHGVEILEVGRVIVGAESMTVSGLTPSKPVTVVMRTVLEQSAVVRRTASRAVESYSFCPDQRLRMLVDGNDAGEAAYKVSDGGFCEVSFVIPGEHVSDRSVRLTLVGEHVSCSFRFYQ